MVLQALNGFEHFESGFLEQRTDLHHVFSGFHFEDYDLNHGAVGVIKNIVDCPGQLEDVFTVKRSNEGAVQFVNQQASGFIRFLFFCSQLIGELRIGIVHVCQQQIHAFQGQIGLLLNSLQKNIPAFLKDFQHNSFLRSE